MSLTNNINAPIYCKVLVFGSKDHQESIELRRKVLRLPLGLNFTEDELNSESDQIHIAAFQNEKLIGILLLKGIEASDKIIKMRQVAVDPNLQGSGIGSLMVKFAERWSIDNGLEIMELHARETAVHFYQKLGYQTVGEGFEEVGIPHYKMFRKL